VINLYSSEFDEGNLTMGVFIDLSKAFITIYHHILLDQLYSVRHQRYVMIGLVATLNKYEKERKTNLIHYDYFVGNDFAL